MLPQSASKGKPGGILNVMGFYAPLANRFASSDNLFDNSSFFFTGAFPFCQLQITIGEQNGEHFVPIESDEPRIRVPDSDCKLLGTLCIASL
jgi:hypothetical protein